MRKVNTILLATLIVFVSANWIFAASLYRMVYPQIVLKKGERIVSVQIRFNNVSIRSISNIHPDWSVGTNLEIQPDPIFNAQCGHGAGALESESELPSVTVEPLDSSIQNIEAQATVEIAIDFSFTKSRKLKVTLKGTKP